jgi:hypothetical protein
MSDRYEQCPLKAAGLRLVTFSELPTVVIGPDDKCICTEADRCLDVDRKTRDRCTLKELKTLNSQAIFRRAWQSGE